MRRVALLLAAIMLVAAACGDDDAAEETNGGAATAVSDSSAGGGGSAGDTPSVAATTVSESSGGSSDSFCRPDNVDAVFDRLDFTSLGNLEEQFRELREALDRWAELAPNEIEDDVEFLVQGMRGMVELFEEYDYNFLAIGTQAADDARLTIVDSAEYQAAADRVAEFCGFEPDDSSLELPGSGSGGGAPSGGFVSDADLPDGFPENLVPPDSEITFAGAFGGAGTVEFSSTATVQEIRDFYEDQVGDPVLVDSESILWTVTEGSSFTNITVSGRDGAVDIMIALIGS